MPDCWGQRLRPAGYARHRIAFRFLSFLLCALFVGHSAHAQLTGTKNIPGDYASLAAAITDLDAVGVGAGGVTLSIFSKNPQTAPPGGYAITTLTGTAANPIVINCGGNVITASAAHTAGALNDAIFKIIGSDFVTITNCHMVENSLNTVTSAASNNMTEWGVALLYASATNGAQNNTIQGNIITLNRTYANTFGIYSNSTHSATNVTTLATATGAAGGNSGLKIHGNTISNVNIGIVVVGPTAAADQDQAIDIGGNAVATGNILTNFGTGNTTTAYAGVASGVSGILVSNSVGYNVAFNTIQSSNGGTTGTNLRGIYVPAFSTVPTGAFTDVIDGNNISLRSASTNGVANAIQGILVEASTVNATTQVDIENNDFNTTGHTVADVGAITFITQHGAAKTTNIIGNTFTNMTVNTSGNVTFIDDSVTRPGGAAIAINNNSIVTAFSKTGDGGAVRFYSNTASSPSTVNEGNSGNNFSNVTLVGTTALDGWVSRDGFGGGARKSVTNNIFDNIVAGTGSVAILQVGFSDASFGFNNVTGNTISNVGSGGVVVGIASPGVNAPGGGGSQNIAGNTVHSLSSSGAALVSGILVNGGTTQNVSANRIYDLQATNAGGSVTGINVTDGTTVTVFNNLVGDLRTPAANDANPLNGITLSQAVTSPKFNLSFNTIFLNAVSSGTNFGSSGILAPASASAATEQLTLIDNIIVNTSGANGSGATVALRRSGSSFNNYASGSNNNLFFAGTPGATHLIFSDGTDADQTFAAFQARVAPRDSASVTDLPPFLSVAGADATFLHIDPAVVTQIESGGKPVSLPFNITTDFDGDTRNATTPDIGADEFTGPVPPAISYVPLHDTTLGTNRILTATITDSDGIAAGANAPRIYFRKNAGAYSSTQCSGSSPGYNCMIDNSLIGGVATGDVIGYFVIAQDVAGHVVSNPKAGLQATDVNTVATPPSPVPAYSVILPIPASLSVGVGQAITSLTNPGGLFDTINKGVLTSDVTAGITSDLLSETGAVSLLPFNEEGVGGFTLTIQPSGGAARIVAGSNSTALLDFNGVQRVTLNGLNTGGNALLIRNTAGSTARTIRFINDASNDSVLNCTIEAGGIGGDGISLDTGLVTGNDNIQIVGNIIRDRSDAPVAAPFNGIVSFGNSLTITNSNLLVADNQILNFNTAGILINGADGAMIINNEISQTRPQTTTLYGILVQSTLGSNLIGQNLIHDLGTNVAATGIELDDARSTLVSRNRIWNFPSTAGSTATQTGIAFAGSAANPAAVELTNNMVTIAPAFANAQAVIGIVDSGLAGNLFTAYFNSIFIAGSGAGSTSSWALLRDVNAPTTYVARNNIAFNNRASPFVDHFAAGDETANGGSYDSDFNFFAGTGATAANFMDYGLFAGTPTAFAGWQAGPPARDAHSVAGTAGSFAVSDYFVDVASGDLHLQRTASLVIAAGVPIPGITIDFDDAPRPPLSPSIGADELDEIFKDGFDVP